MPGDSDLGDVDIGDSGRVVRGEPAHAQRPAARLRIRIVGTPLAGIRRKPRRRQFRRADSRRAGRLSQRGSDRGAGDANHAGSSLTARLRGARYDIDLQGDSTSYGAGAAVGHAHRHRDRDLRCDVGAQEVEYENGFKQTAWLAGGGVSMPLGRNKLFADLTRSVGPSSAGIVITRDQLRLRWHARLHAAAGLPGRRARHPRRDFVDPDRTLPAAQLCDGRRGPAVALAGGVLAALVLRLHLAEIRRTR